TRTDTEILTGEAALATIREAVAAATAGSPNVTLLEHFAESRALLFVTTRCRATAYGDRPAGHAFRSLTTADCQNGITESRGLLTGSRRKNYDKLVNTRRDSERGAGTSGVRAARFTHARRRGGCGHRRTSSRTSGRPGRGRKGRSGARPAA